jgi:hypothetical protein
MKKMRKSKLLMILSAGIFAMMISCENQEIDFPDYDYSAVYFAYQYPVRTLVLGESTTDNSMDNSYKCSIYATMGGVYENTKCIDIDITVDTSLCDNLYFDSDYTTPVNFMPADYYTLAADKITLDGVLSAGVEVQLADAFFADPQSISNTYVIPLLMTSVVNADSILSGTPSYDGAVRTNEDAWDVLPKDYVLYCVKFVNPWHGNYLRRGTDVITTGGETTTIVRHEEYVEYDEVCSMTTASLTSVEFPVSVVDANDETNTCTLLLTFDDENNCVVSSISDGFIASGSGSFVSDGEKDSWGNQDRSAIYLDYTIEMDSKTYATMDTLVVRDRGVAMETFSPSYQVN